MRKKISLLRGVAKPVIGAGALASFVYVTFPSEQKEYIKLDDSQAETFQNKTLRFNQITLSSGTSNASGSQIRMNGLEDLSLNPTEPIAFNLGEIRNKKSLSHYNEDNENQEI